MDPRTTLRDYLLAEFLPGEPETALRDDTPLRANGILDSMGTLAVVSFVETTFGISVEAHESDEGNFGTVRDILAFVERKKAGG